MTDKASQGSVSKSLTTESIELSHQGCPIRIKLVSDMHESWRYSIINLFDIQIDSSTSYLSKEQALLAAKQEVTSFGGQQMLFLSSGGGASFCTEEDLHFVHGALERYRTFRSIPDIISLGGFLTAIFSAPKPPKREVWHSAMWGPGCEEPSMSSAQEKDRFISTIDILFAAEGQRILQEREHYLPNFLVEPNGEIFPVAAEAWCMGYFAGTTVEEQSWRGQWEKLSQPISSIFQFVAPDQQDRIRAMPEAAQTALRQEIPGAVYRIFQSNWTYRMQMNGEIGPDEVMDIAPPEQMRFAQSGEKVQ